MDQATLKSVFSWANAPDAPKASVIARAVVEISVFIVDHPVEFHQWVDREKHEESAGQTSAVASRDFVPPCTRRICQRAISLGPDREPARNPRYPAIPANPLHPAHANLRGSWQRAEATSALILGRMMVFDENAVASRLPFSVKTALSRRAPCATKSNPWRRRLLLAQGQLSGFDKRAAPPQGAQNVPRAHRSTLHLDHPIKAHR